MIPIKVSYKWLSKKCKCSEEIIKNVCHGRCCGKNDLVICVTDDEKKNLTEKYGCDIQKNKLLGKCGKCVFMNDSGLCLLHNTQDKPMGCIVSPFKINKNNTLIIRHRYIHFPCFKIYKDGDPAYITFANSLIKIFGEETYKQIKYNMENGSDDFYVDIDPQKLKELNFLEILK